MDRKKKWGKINNIFLKFKFFSRKAFTLIELLAAGIFIATMVSLVVIKYDIVIERMRASEGVNILFAVLTAEKEWVVSQTPIAPNYTSTFGNLAVQLPTSGNFDPPTLNAVAVNSNAIVADVHRTSSFNYTLHIREAAGTVTCTSPTAGLCAKLGY